jgi:1-deoxy-D-xylulose-5-phosphate reductoisomerase
MKKKIIILGSTGSIGVNTLNLIKKDNDKFKIVLLSANKNYIKLTRQAKEFNVRDLIITDLKAFSLAKKKYKNFFNFYNDFEILNTKFKAKEIDYSMVSIIGLSGLFPTLKCIRISKNISIANKESLICAWRLISDDLKRFKTNFIPIDSEHFSIYSLIKNKLKNTIKKVYITASGGPFLKSSISKIHKATIKDAINHPNWKMGKKISIDSSTMMNKIFEVIEAKNIFDLDYSQISILIHPQSYLHSIVEFTNGTITFLVHESDMKIPIANSLYLEESFNYNSKKLNLNILNDLKLKKIDSNKFPLIKILKNLENKNSLYETVLVTINDYFVNKFLSNKISYKQLIQLISSNANNKDFLKFKKKKPNKPEDIVDLINYVHIKLEKLNI